MKSSNLIVVILALAGTAAGADAGRYSATLAAPVTKTQEFIASGNVWRCSGSTCVLVSEPKDPNALGSCAGLRRSVGELTSYGTAGKLYDDAKLTKCNSFH